MSSQQVPIPPTGRLTIPLDWAADLAVPPRCGATLESATWTLPAGITQQAASIDGTKAIITINTSNLKLNGNFRLICSATLSNGDILPAAVECIAVYRNTRRSSEVCPP